MSCGCVILKLWHFTNSQHWTENLTCCPKKNQPEEQQQQGQSVALKHIYLDCCLQLTGNGRCMLLVKRTKAGMCWWLWLPQKCACILPGNLWSERDHFELQKGSYVENVCYFRWCGLHCLSFPRTVRQFTLHFFFFLFFAMCHVVIKKSLGLAKKKKKKKKEGRLGYCSHNISLFGFMRVYFLLGAWLWVTGSFCTSFLCVRKYVCYPTDTFTLRHMYLFCVLEFICLLVFWWVLFCSF